MDIDATASVRMLHILGLSLTTKDGRLTVGPSDLLDDDVRLFIRKHKAEIIAALQRADKPAWAWLVVFDGFCLETYHHPDKTRAQVKRMYPRAIRVEPLPESMWPADNAKEQAA